MPGGLALVDGRDQIGAQNGGFRRQFPGFSRHQEVVAADRQLADHRKTLAGFGGAPFVRDQRSPESLDGGFVGQHFPLVGQVLGGGGARHGVARQRIQVVELRVAHHKTPGGAARHGHLERQLREGLHGGLERQPGGQGMPRGRRALGALHEPAGDGVPGEAQHAAAVALDFADQGVIHGVDQAGQLFDAAPRAVLLDQRLGQGGKAGDIGKQRRAAGAVGERFAARQGAPAVLGQVGVQHGHGRPTLSASIYAMGMVRRSSPCALASSFRSASSRAKTAACSPGSRTLFQPSRKPSLIK